MKMRTFHNVPSIEINEYTGISSPALSGLLTVRVSRRVKGLRILDEAMSINSLKSGAQIY
jgi:hypothetical protein